MLSKEFLSKYPDFPPQMSEMAKFVYYRTYSRWLPEKNRRETWKETCERAVNYNCSLAPISSREDELLFDNMFNLKQFISGRSLWIGGTKAAEKAPLAGFNCSFLVIDSLKSFHELFYLLMVGTGVGIRILPEDVAKLPKFKQNVKLKCFKHNDIPWGNETTKIEWVTDKSAKITVGDSKEGWKSALDAYLMLMTMKRDVEFIYIDFSNIRPKGTPLQTFGGTASGHQSIQEMFEKVHKVITEGAYSHKPKDGKLEPIHCLDICNLIGQNVVVGGVRRTAEIAIISPEDTECVKAKVDLTPDKYHRFMSNNSVYLEKKPTKEQLTAIFDSIRKSGEPGFINVAEAKRRREDFAGCNPCVTGDTNILTKEYGDIPIKEVVGMDVSVWNGYEWSVVTPKVTGYNQPMRRITFTNGSVLECTDYHEFVLHGGERVTAANLQEGDLLETYYYPVIEKQESTYSLACATDVSPYVLGYYSLSGDKDRPVIKVYGSDREDMTLRFKHYQCNIVKFETYDIAILNGPAMRFQVPSVGDTVDYRISWLSGLIDGAGVFCLQENCVEIVEANVDFLKQVVDLLHTLGATGVIEKHYKIDGMWKLLISAENIDKLKSLGLFIDGDVLDYSSVNPLDDMPRVVNVETIDDSPVVYCFTENKNHTGVFNGVMTAQCGEVILPPNAVCNLTTINLPAFVNADGEVDDEALETAIVLSARAAYRMTCLNLELEDWNEVHHRDRLLGCSITGYQDFLGKADIDNEDSFLSWMRANTRMAAEHYAFELGTPSSLKVTAVKPEGTLSLVCNGVSPGLHYQHSEYFIRRIRVNASDPLAMTALKLGWRIHPEVGQTMDDATTLVIDFPCKSTSKKTKFDVSAIEQLDNYIRFQKNYTEQNTSNTITVRPDEWQDVIDYVYKNWDDILAVTFLELNTDYYPLLPYEACTKEEYEKLKNSMKEFDPDILNNMEITTRNLGKEYEILDDREGCEHGVCPIR